MNLIQRNQAKKLHHYLNLFPIVAIIGPRQAGKTTFAKMELPDWQYFDLERPSDYARVSSDIEFFLKHYGDDCIIDEAQTLPELFPALRHHIDNMRGKKGRIVLLGSVNPMLVKNISESLAGRIGFVELSPFQYSEVRPILSINIEDFWLKGGYPEPLLWNIEDHMVWMQQYVKTFVERDIIRTLKSSLSPQRQIQLLTMLAHWHGKLWNASQISSAFGVSYHTINNYLDVMEGHFLIRRLVPYHKNIGKRLVKSPKFYYRDTGLLHYLLNVLSIEVLRVSPYRGFSFEGFVIEQLINKHLLTAKGQVRFYFFRTAQGHEIDLLVFAEGQAHAYEIKAGSTVQLSDIDGFKRALEYLNIDKGVVIYFGEEDFSLTRQIDVRTIDSVR